MSEVDDDIKACQIQFPVIPETFGIKRENAVSENIRKGGETQGTKLLQRRLAIEKKAFENGLYLPNHSNPDFVNGASLSPHLRFGKVVRHSKMCHKRINPSNAILKDQGIGNF